MLFIAPQGVKGSRMAGSVVLTGRSKDTIVLSSGENIEPQPIEDALCESQYVKFAVLVGQDCKHVGALLVPDQDALAEVAASRGTLRAIILPFTHPFSFPCFPLDHTPTLYPGSLP